MIRSPLKRRTPLRRGKQLAKRSLKMTERYVERRRMVADLLGRFPVCQFPQCVNKSVDIHEPLSRARGGSITDETNAVALCRACHSWVHDHPQQATELSLLRSATPADIFAIYTDDRKART